MGKKYIIEMEDKPFKQYEDVDEPLYRVKGFNALVFDEVGISRLTPYTEPDLERVKADAYLEGLKDGQGVTIESQQNNAFNDGYKKCLKDLEQIRKAAYENGYENGFVAGYLKAEKSGQSFYEDGRQRGLADADACGKTGDSLPSHLDKIINILCEGKI